MAIYKLWRGRFTEAWYRLSQDEQQQLIAKVVGALEQVGAKELIACESAWSNERWQGFGVEEFQDLEAAQRHQQILLDLAWARYFDSETTLGTEMTTPGT